MPPIMDRSRSQSLSSIGSSGGWSVIAAEEDDSDDADELEDDGSVVIIKSFDTAVPIIPIEYAAVCVDDVVPLHVGSFGLAFCL